MPQLKSSISSLFFVVSKEKKISKTNSKEKGDKEVKISAKKSLKRVSASCAKVLQRKIKTEAFEEIAKSHSIEDIEGKLYSSHPYCIYIYI